MRMIHTLIRIACMMVLIGAFVGCRKKETPVGKKDTPIFGDLRNQVLALTSAASGIPPLGTNAVFGVVMDIGFPEGWATIVALADGNASLYLSGGGGVIGGVGHEKVRNAAIAMNQVADTFAKQTKTTTSTPLPKPGEVTFYLLTTRGILTVTAREEDLGEERDVLSPLFYAGQDVITQLRLVSDVK